MNVIFDSKYNGEPTSRKCEEVNNTTHLCKKNDRIFLLISMGYANSPTCKKEATVTVKNKDKIPTGIEFIFAVHILMCDGRVIITDSLKYSRDEVSFIVCGEDATFIQDNEENISELRFFSTHICLGGVQGDSVMCIARRINSGIYTPSEMNEITELNARKISAFSICLALDKFNRLPEDLVMALKAAFPYRKP